MIIEICCGDLQSVIAARDGGAVRIELCSGLAEGGLTPSAGLIRAAHSIGIEQINVLVRPRPGDFLYSPAEQRLMAEDIRLAIGSGATGIVTGVLTSDGEVDLKACRQLVEISRATAAECGLPGINLTFHRAFDVSRDPFISLQQIIDLGFDTLLTSGMAISAPEGIGMLRELVERAGTKIRIMAGSGVNPANAADIVAATGVTGIHSTARRPLPSGMRFRRPKVAMGAPGMDEYAPLRTSPDVVRQLIDSVLK